MIRSVLTLALSVVLLAEASAQTTPATVKKATAKSVKASARQAKKARRVALKTTPVAPLANDGWPTDDAASTAVASVASDGWDTSAPAASTSRGEIDNQSISAAPGMPIHVRTGNGLTPYSVRPARKPAATQTTLGN